MRAAAVLLLIAPLLQAQSSDEAILARQGIRPDRESIARYLGLMFPDEALRERIDRLVEQLGAPSAAVRDGAMRELMLLDSAPLAALRGARDHESPEVRRLAGHLVDRIEASLDPQLLAAVLRTIRDRRIKGLTDEVLDALTLSSDIYFRAEALRTLLVTMRPEDRGIILRAAGGGPPEVRAAAFTALRSLAPADAPDVLVPALADPSEKTRVAAARELVELGDRRGLPALVDLLDAGDDGVRMRAHATLRAVSGESFGYVGNAAPERRAEAITAWRAWLEREGATAEWKTPIRYGRPMLGRTLVALYSQNRVVEFDTSGRVVWEVEGLVNPWAVHGMPNGHRLVTLYSAQQIVEYDAAGKRVWESEKLGSNVGSAWSTRAGRILVALGYANNRIVEIDRASKKIVWELVVPGRPVCAVELENGHFLLTLNQSNEVVEIDRTGKRLWAVGGLKSPYSANRLPNGNTLVADHGARRVVEFDPSKKQVWEYKGDGKTPLQWAYTAARLADGTTLLGDQQGLKRIDHTGREIWKYEAPNAYVYFHRY